MPTVAAGGSHILNIDFLLLQICQGSDGTKGDASKTNTLLTMKKKNKENKEKNYS